MSMLVSDYDGTFANSKKNIELNCNAITKYLNEGNTFVLSSGRSYESLSRKIKKYRIPYSYIACADGSYLFDKEANLLLTHQMNHEAISQVSVLERLLDSGRVDYTYEREYSPVYDPNKPLSSFSIVVRNDDITDKLVNKFQELKKNNPQYDYSFYGFEDTSYFIVKAKGISKSSPIVFLQKKLNVPSNDIFTVGDGLNDLEMIRDYNGFVVGNKKELLEVALDKYYSVHNLVDDIMKKKVKRR